MNPRKWLWGLLFVLLVALCTACTAGSPDSQSNQTNVAAQFHQITPGEAKQRMEENPQVIVVDVRTPEEYKEKHIPQAVLIPNETITQTPPALLPDLNAEILVYCRTGVRSRQAAEKLAALGYTQVYDLGGIQDWPYETVAGDS